MFVTPVPPIRRLVFAAVGARTTPRTLIVALPSLVTLPPSMALLAVTAALDGEVTVGATAARVTVTV